MVKILTIFVVLIFAIDSFCCAHFPLDYKDTLNEKQREAFLYHDGENAHLIIRTHFEAKKLPKELAWVLPFPSLPVKYEEVDSNIFKELYKSTVFKPRHGQKGGMVVKKGLMSAFKVHKAVKVGNYKIQPIEILKDNSAKEFNSWLTKNKYNAMPYEIQKYYLKKGAVFLAIRMKPKGLSSIAIKPLHIIYPAKQVTVPIKFSHDNRIFDLNLYVYSKSQLHPKSTLELSVKQHLERKNVVEFNPKNKKKHPILSKLIKSSGYITKFTANGLNRPDKLIKDIKDDPTFSIEQLRN